MTLTGGGRAGSTRARHECLCSLVGLALSSTLCSSMGFISNTRWMSHVHCCTTCKVEDDDSSGSQQHLPPAETRFSLGINASCFGGCEHYELAEVVPQRLAAEASHHRASRREMYHLVKHVKH